MNGGQKAEREGNNKVLSSIYYNIYFVRLEEINKIISEFLVSFIDYRMEFW